MQYLQVFLKEKFQILAFSYGSTEYMTAKRSLGKSEPIHIDLDGILLLIALDLPNEVFLISFSL